MIDSHTHLDLLEDPDAAVQAARDAGVHGLITVGLDVAGVDQTLATAARYPGYAYVAIGVHPNSAPTFDESQWPALETLARDPRIVGIGETGLDSFRSPDGVDAQEALFVRHIDLARAVGKPLIIHSRSEDERTLRILADHADALTVILHCFSMAGHVDEAVERGYICSFAGNVTYGSAQDLRDAMVRVPTEQLMVETDAPFLTPVPHRGQKNHPAFVAHTLAAMAIARGEDPAELDRATTATAERAFGVTFAPVTAV